MDIDFTIVLIDLVVTVLMFLAVPVYLIFIKKNRYEKEEARKIAIWNAIIVQIFFIIIKVIFSDETNEPNIFHIAPAFVWGSVGYSILLKSKKDNNVNKEQKSEDIEVKESTTDLKKDKQLDEKNC